MFAFTFSRLFAAALFLVASVIANYSVNALPAQVARSPSGGYTGSTGSANGGDVTHSASTQSQDSCSHCSNPIGTILNIDSNNGGEGGQSSSGDASVMNAPGSQQDGSSSGAYTGASGSADGGSTTSSGGLFNLGSNNGGDAGCSKSGNALVSRCQSDYSRDGEVLGDIV